MEIFHEDILLLNAINVRIYILLVFLVNLDFALLVVKFMLKIGHLILKNNSLMFNIFILFFLYLLDFVQISSFPIGLNFKFLLKLLISLLNIYLKNLVSILLELLLILIHFQEILIGTLIFIVFLLMIDIKK